LHEHAVGGASEGLTVVKAAPNSFADGADIDSVVLHGILSLRRRLGFLLARQLAYAVTTRRQDRFLDHQHREAILDLETQRAALAGEVVAFEQQPSSAGIEGAPQDFQEFLADHESRPNQ